MSADVKKVLIIGGRGKIAKLATEMLSGAGAEITSMVRNDESRAEVEPLGSTALVQDLTELSVEQWGTLVEDFDVVLWSAGNGGRGGADVTYAVDRDGALTLIEALESMDLPPRLIMVSYVGALDNTAEDDGGTWYAYVESKKAVDRRLVDSDIEYTILAPAALHDGPATGIEIVDNTPSAAEAKQTSRELVAEVIAECALREDHPQQRIVACVDGKEEILSIEL